MRKRGEDEKKEEEEEEEEEGRPDGRCLSLSVNVRSSVETSKDVGPLFCFVFFFLRRTAGGSQSSGRVQPSTQVTSFPPLLLRFVVIVLSCQTERQRREQWDLIVYKVSLVMWCKWGFWERWGETLWPAAGWNQTAPHGHRRAGSEKSPLLRARLI